MPVSFCLFSYGIHKFEDFVRLPNWNLFSLFWISVRTVLVAVENGKTPQEEGRSIFLIQQFLQNSRINQLKLILLEYISNIMNFIHEFEVSALKNLTLRVFLIIIIMFWSRHSFTRIWKFFFFNSIIFYEYFHKFLEFSEFMWLKIYVSLFFLLLMQVHKNSKYWKHFQEENHIVLTWTSNLWIPLTTFWKVSEIHVYISEYIIIQMKIRLIRVRKKIFNLNCKESHFLQGCRCILRHCA